MINRASDFFNLECDFCGNEVKEYFDDFYDAVSFKNDKSNGWKSRKFGSDWYDICPEHEPDEIKEFHNKIKDKEKRLKK